MYKTNRATGADRLINPGPHEIDRADRTNGSNRIERVDDCLYWSRETKLKSVMQI